MMRLLLDIQVFIWFLKGDSRVGPATAAAIRDPANEVSLSAAAVWEAVIKQSLGKLILPAPAAARYLPEKRVEMLIASLPIVEADFERLANLPHHHRDPLDRLMIAQSLHHGLTNVTADPLFSAYSAPLLNPSR